MPVQPGEDAWRSIVFCLCFENSFCVLKILSTPVLRGRDFSRVAPASMPGFTEIPNERATVKERPF